MKKEVFSVVFRVMISGNNFTFQDGMSHIAFLRQFQLNHHFIVIESKEDSQSKLCYVNRLALLNRHITEFGFVKFFNF